MSAVEERLGLQFFHTPLVIHAPGADLGGEVRSVPGSQYDLVPTADMAAYYAKVDIELLMQVAQPWPEVIR